MKILLSIPSELLHQLDVYCTSNGYTRSEFIRQCIRVEINSAIVPSEKEVKKAIDNAAGDSMANLGIVPMTATAKHDTFNKLKDQFSEPIYSTEDL